MSTLSSKDKRITQNRCLSIGFAWRRSKWLWFIRLTFLSVNEKKQCPLSRFRAEEWSMRWKYLPFSYITKNSINEMMTIVLHNSKKSLSEHRSIHQSKEEQQQQLISHCISYRYDRTGGPRKRLDLLDYVLQPFWLVSLSLMRSKKITTIHLQTSIIDSCHWQQVFNQQHIHFSSDSFFFLSFSLLTYVYLNTSMRVSLKFNWILFYHIFVRERRKKKKERKEGERKKNNRIQLNDKRRKKISWDLLIMYV